MKWQVVDKKYNSAKNTTQEYNITLETTEENNTVEVKVTVPACPKGQRPVTWNAINVLNWLQQQGYNVSNTLSSETLTDASAIANTGTYSFSIKQAQNKTKQTKTNKTRKNSTKSSAPSRTDKTANVVTSNLNIDTE
jgi:hypothetical protein